MSYSPEFVTTNGQHRTLDDRCIVSCGIGPDYQEPLHSTRLHCEINAPEAWRLFYRDYPDGCPLHSEMQYAFKIYALRRAIDAGFRYVVWMDSSFQPIRSMAPMWERLKEHGWYAPRQGDSKLGEWCSDSFVLATQTSRDYLMKLPLVYSGLVGFDMKAEWGQGIWEEWKRLYEQGWFNGHHLNKPGKDREPWGVKWSGHVSHDKRVQGHRHDEAALSWILWQRGLIPPDPDFFAPGGFIGQHVKLVIPG